MQGKVGFIGLGLMGKPMARNLMRAGYQLLVNNRTAEKAEELGREGASVAPNGRSVAEQCDIVITMLPDSPDVEQVGSAGWVARLFSGVQNLEESGKNGMMRRGVARREAILNAVFDTSRRVRGAAADPCGLAFYSTAALDAARDGLHGGDMPGRIAAEIVAEAERTLGVGPWSVLDKSLVAPSGALGTPYPQPASTSRGGAFGSG